jgi:cytoskeletal protein RodZ
VARLPPSSSPSLSEPRSPSTAARTSGHHVRNRDTTGRRSRATSSTAAIDATATAATTSDEAERGPDGSSRLRFRLALEKASSSTSSTAWTSVLANESIAPAVTAAVAGMPWRWKKRMLIAMRARLDGRARFM